jgi:hypothetical protein
MTQEFKTFKMGTTFIKSLYSIFFFPKIIANLVYGNKLISGTLNISNKLATGQLSFFFLIVNNADYLRKQKIMRNVIKKSNTSRVTSQRPASDATSFPHLYQLVSTSRNNNLD